MRQDEPANEADASGDLAFDRLYAELRALARQHFAKERDGHTLQPTALVHEAYLRILRGENPLPDDPEQLYRAAAVAMRRILIDHARKKARVRHGQRRKHVSLDVVELAASGDLDEILAVDEAIERLQGEDPDAAELVRLRFYAGLSPEEIARALGRSERSVYRDWAYAKAWLYHRLADKSS